MRTKTEPQNYFFFMFSVLISITENSYLKTVPLDLVFYLFTFAEYFYILQSVEFALNGDKYGTFEAAVHHKEEGRQ